MAIDQTNARQWTRGLVTSSTATSFAAKIATATEPTGDGVHVMKAGDNLEVLPFGAGADNNTFGLRVVGWRSVGTTLWVPEVLAEFTCTLSASVGVAGQPVTDTDRFADTMVVVTGITAVRTGPVDTPLSGSLSVSGYEKLEFIYDMVTATNGNCLFVRY